MPNIIQAEYQTLEDVSNQFEQLSDRVQDLYLELANATEDLRGEWVGYGADAFFFEMDHTILLAVRGLKQALSDTSAGIAYIAAELEDAEIAATTTWWERWGENVHLGLDLIGFIPGLGEIADGVNGLIYLAEGRYVEAGISAASMLPIWGDLGKLGKWGKATSEIISEGGEQLAKEAAEKTAKEASEELATEAAEKLAKQRANLLEIADGGHSIARHGPEVTDQQLMDRLTTGIAPDGKWSPAPRKSTKFESYDDWVKTRDDALNKFLSDNNIDINTPPSGTLLANPRAIDLDHGRSIGDGYVGVGQPRKIRPPNKPNGKLRKVWDETAPIDNIQRTRTKFEWNPKKNQWIVVQHFPNP